MSHCHPSFQSSNLPIPQSVKRFLKHANGLASPVFRTNPGFVGLGRTVGGAREFVIPNRRVQVSRDIHLRILN